MQISKFKRYTIAIKAIVFLFISIGLVAIASYLSSTIDSTIAVILGQGEISELPQDRDVLDFFGITAFFSFFNIKSVFEASFAQILIHLVGYMLMIVIGYVLIVPEIAKILKEKDTYEIKNEYGSHGTSEWASDKEIQSRYHNCDKIGWFIGSDKEGVDYHLEETLTHSNYLYHSVENDMKINMQMVVCGPPGSNKTTGFVLPNLLHIPTAYTHIGELADVICTDPKNELVSLSYKTYIDKGYDVWLLDFINTKYGDTFNPLYYIQTEEDLLSFSSNFISAFQGSAPGGDTFWRDSAQNLIAALVGYVLQKKPFEEQNLIKVVEVMQSENVKNFEKAKDFFVKEGLSGAALFAWNNFLAAGKSEETYASILVTLATSMSMFAFENVQVFTSTNSCNITKIGKAVTPNAERLKKDLTIQIKEAKEKRTEVLTEKNRLLKRKYDIVGEAIGVLQFDEETGEVIYPEEKELEQSVELLSDELVEIILTLKQKKAAPYRPAANEAEKIKLEQDLLRFEKAFSDCSEIDMKLAVTNNLHEKLTKVLNEYERDLSDIKEKPIALFIAMPDDDPSKRPLINLCVNSIFMTLYATARESKGGKLPVPVYFILEEFNNIGKLAGIEEKLGTMRGKRIYPMLIIQSLSQLKDKYEKEWENILSQCDTTIVLGCNDNTTAEYISNALGAETISTQSGSDNTLTDITTNLSSLSEQYTGRQLLFASEIRSFAADKIIGIASHNKPFVATKTQLKYWENNWIKKHGTSIPEVFPVIEGYREKEKLGLSDVEEEIKEFMENVE